MENNFDIHKWQASFKRKQVIQESTKIDLGGGEFITIDKDESLDTITIQQTDADGKKHLIILYPEEIDKVVQTLLKYK